MMRELTTQWNQRSQGVRLHPDHFRRLNNLRFADDLLIVATSSSDIRAMLADLSEEARGVGLTLHPDKTKVLHNGHGHSRRCRPPQHIQANGMTIEVLPPFKSCKYLGRKVQFSDPHGAELDKRIATAWKKFFSLKQELLCKDYSLHDRLRLFHGCVTPTALYGCEAWTLTSELENRLRRTERHMLRMILGAKRRRQQRADSTTRDQPDKADTSNNDARNDTTDSSEHGTDTTSDNINLVEETNDDLEPWVDWIKRVTAEARARISQLNIEDWTTTQRRRKFQWAKQVVCGPVDSWAMKVSLWRPDNDPDGSPHRRPGRQKTRWTDSLRMLVMETYGHSDWHRVAATPAWDDLLNAYIQQ